MRPKRSLTAEREQQKGNKKTKLQAQAKEDKIKYTSNHPLPLETQPPSPPMVTASNNEEKEDVPFTPAHTDNAIESDSDDDRPLVPTRANSATDSDDDAPLAVSISPSDSSAQVLHALCTIQRKSLSHDIWGKPVGELLPLLKNKQQEYLDALYATYTDGDLQLYAGESDQESLYHNRLFAMVLCNQEELLEKACLCGRDINRLSDKTRKNLLSIAIELKSNGYFTANLEQTEIVSLLLQHDDVEVDHVCNFHSTIAIEAVKTKNVALIKAVLRRANTLTALPRRNDSLLERIMQTFSRHPKFGDIIHILIQKTPYRTFAEDIMQNRGISVPAAGTMKGSTFLRALCAAELKYWETESPETFQNRHKQSRKKRNARTRRPDTPQTLPEEQKQECDEGETGVFSVETVREASRALHENYIHVRALTLCDLEIQQQLWVNAIQKAASLLNGGAACSKEEKIKALQQAFLDELQLSCEQIEPSTHASATPSSADQTQAYSPRFSLSSARENIAPAEENTEPSAFTRA